MAVLGAAAASAYPQLSITESATWVPPMDGNICIHLIGAGGGGCGYGTNIARGGGAGGYCKKNSLAVTTAGSFTLVVGVGGDGGANATGSNGGNTTMAGTGLSSTLTANGGGGGGVSSVAGTGGTASNGDVNNTGGPGGQTGYSGGGAVGVHGTGDTGEGDAGNNDGHSDAMGEGIGSSGYGYVIGGQSAASVWVASGTPWSLNQAGALAGGAGYWANTNAVFIVGQNGGIGGGGGGAYNQNFGSYCEGGRGGDGIIIIQYLPW